MKSLTILNTIWVWVFHIIVGYEWDFYTIQEPSYPSINLVSCWYWLEKSLEYTKILSCCDTYLLSKFWLVLQLWFWLGMLFEACIHLECMWSCFGHFQLHKKKIVVGSNCEISHLISNHASSMLSFQVSTKVMKKVVGGQGENPLFLFKQSLIIPSKLWSLLSMKNLVNAKYKAQSHRDTWHLCTFLTTSLTTQIKVCND